MRPFLFLHLHVFPVANAAIQAGKHGNGPATCTHQKVIDNAFRLRCCYCVFEGTTSGAFGS